MKTYVQLHPAEFFSERKMFKTKAAQRIQTNILFSVCMCVCNRAVCIMWKNTVELDRPQMKT